MSSRRSIGALVFVLLAGCAGEVPGSGPPLVLDLYDVKDITPALRSFPGCNSLCDHPRDEDGFPVIEDPPVCYDGEALAAMIREVIDPDVWAGGGQVDFRAGGVLIAIAPEKTHRRIEALLSGLRGAWPGSER